MAKKKLGQGRLPWMTSKFDLEGYAAGALALILAILLAGFSWIFLLLGLLAFGLVFFATRDDKRTPPDDNSLILSPCDGIVSDISPVTPPRELRIDATEMQRVRIASSPFTVNGVRAPVTGTVATFLVEAGSPTAIATNPDNSELDEAFVHIRSDHGPIGVRVAAGGLGPRVDLDLEPDDGVRSGRKIGVRRLGGWCDIYIPLDLEIQARVGQSVIGGETPVAVTKRMQALPGPDAKSDAADAEIVSEAPTAVSDEMPDTTPIAGNVTPTVAAGSTMPTPDQFEPASDIAPVTPGEPDKPA